LEVESESVAGWASHGTGALATGIIPEEVFVDAWPPVSRRVRLVMR